VSECDLVQQYNECGVSECDQVQQYNECGVSECDQVQQYNEKVDEVRLRKTKRKISVRDRT
jgi:hypothetical protein